MEHGNDLGAVMSRIVDGADSGGHERDDLARRALDAEHLIL